MPADATTPLHDEHTLRAVRGRLSLELETSVTNPFSIVPGREQLIRDAIRRALAEESGASVVPDTIVDDLYDELVGLGPLQPLMADPNTTDILVNRWAPHGAGSVTLVDMSTAEWNTADRRLGRRA